METRKPSRKEGIALRRMGDECVLYDPDEGNIHIINAAAAAVWEMCDGSHSLAEMEQELRAKYVVPQCVDVQADLQAVLQRLESLAVLAWEGTGEAP